MLKLAPSTDRYRARVPSERERALQRRLAEVSAKHPGYDYRRIAALLEQKDLEVGKRQVQRWRREVD
jgi:hypothetical protein